MAFTLLLIIGFISFAWLSIKNPPLALVFFLGILPSYLIRFSLGPIPTTFLEICFIILFSTWFTSNITKGKGTAHFTIPIVPIIIFLASSILILIPVPPKHLLASLGLWRAYLVEPLLLFWMLSYEFRSNKIKLHAFFSITLSATIFAIIGILQYFTAVGIPAPWDIERRITSIFDYPNALGLFLAPVVSACIIFLFITRKQRTIQEKCATIFSCIIMIIAILLAKTEAALVAIPFAITIITLLSPHILRTKKIFIGTMGITVFIAALSITPIRQKLLLQDFSGQVRLSQWKETIFLIKDDPFFGAGFGAYPIRMQTYHHAQEYEIFQYPHNILLNIWTELGILGIVGSTIGCILLGKHALQKKDDPLVVAATTALLTMLIHGFVDVPFFKNDLAMMTVCFVAIILTTSLHKRDHATTM